MKTKVIAAVCAVLVVLSGCSGGNGTTGKGTLDFKGYPIETNEKLTYWTGINTAISTVVDNAGKTEFAKELAKKTGVEIEWIHPAAGQEDTTLSLLIASNQMPDMVEYNWAGYNGGAAKSLKEEIILPLNEIMEKNAPNFKKYLGDNPEIDKMVKTDDGKYYAFPFIRGDKRLLISVGTLIRRDWLEELGLNMPATAEEMENVLRAFKEKKGASAPLSFEAGELDKFLGNFSTTSEFYVDDNGKIQYGPLDDRYEYALRTLNKWYAEGLFDPNFISTDATALDAKVLGGQTGITVKSGGGGLGTWLDNKKNTGESFDMVGMPYTAARAGEKNTYYRVESNYPGYGSVAITSSCKNVDLAARFLDYGYSEEGEILYNYGTEGVSYEKKDGQYIYTDEVMSNPDGLTVAQGMAKYFRASMAGPFVQQRGYIDQFYFRPAQQETLDAWLAGYDNVKSHVLPPISKTEEETKEYSSIMNEVNKYLATSRTEFINGNASFDKYNDFKDQLKKLKIDRAVEITQAAYDRYMKK